jgi:hypothetical protein
MSTEVQFNLYDFSEETLEFLYNLPTEFPPSAHTHSVTDITDLPDLVDGTGSISVSSIETNELTVQEAATINGTLNADDIQGNLTGNIYVSVQAGQNLLKGDPVYISGTYTSGAVSLPIVSRADSSDPAKMPAAGIMDADLNTGINGSMVISGRIADFNTNAYNLNAELYVASGGGFTATAPTARAQVVARVERKDSNFGSVIVSIDSISSITSATTSDGTAQLDIASLGFNTTSGLTAGVGDLTWNNDDGTLDLGLKGGNVTLQIGQESVSRVVNKTGANLLESQYRVVRIRSTSEGGAQGQRLAVVLAQANNDANSVDTFGIVTENITVNQEGFITTSGIVRGINTTGSLQGETWVDGDVLYLSPTTPGVLTHIKPQAPNHTIIVGFVVYAHSNQGKIYVKVDNGYEIDELHNVKITDVANNNVLRYNAIQSVWENTDSLSLSSLTIGGVAAAKVVDPVRTTVTGNGATSVYAISGASGLTNPSALIVAIDGSLQEPGADYSVSGGNIIFTSPLESGAKAVVISPVNTVQVGQVVPSDGSVTSAKIANSVTLTTPSLVGPVDLTSQDASTADRIMTRDLVDSRTIIATLPSSLTVNDSASYNATSMVLSLTPGWWEINGEFRIDGTVSAAGAKLYLAFTGGLPEAYLHRIWIASVSSGSTTSSLLLNNPTYGSGTQPFLLSQSIASTTVGIFKVGPSLIYLTANATITVGFSQNTANASDTTMLAFPLSRIWATRLKY